MCCFKRRFAQKQACNKIRVLQDVFRIQARAAEKMKVQHIQIHFNGFLQFLTGNEFRKKRHYYFILGKPIF
jgi:hypothetical protein